MKLIKKLLFLKLVNRKKSLLLIFFFFGIFSIQSQVPEFVKNVSGILLAILPNIITKVILFPTIRIYGLPTGVQPILNLLQH
ncbi:hypothetical protein [Flavobacterium franklandianum]|uniref:Uncharacterized protein n=1 Tax=Flavobacterium franklandianum TaxID=2594430 RepID=A0A553CR01_9FLAO|nr:hypothetical protein [Flavobacterium franklandianum]TRX22881.1 hypothetical protein FNW17_03705 [Flavobacterium franklandianum]